MKRGDFVHSVSANQLTRGICGAWFRIPSEPWKRALLERIEPELSAAITREEILGWSFRYDGATSSSGDWTVGIFVAFSDETERGMERVRQILRESGGSPVEAPFSWPLDRESHLKRVGTDSAIRAHLAFQGTDTRLAISVARRLQVDTELEKTEAVLATFAFLMKALGLPPAEWDTWIRTWTISLSKMYGDDRLFRLAEAASRSIAENHPYLILKASRFRNGRFGPLESLVAPYQDGITRIGSLLRENANQMSEKRPLNFVLWHSFIHEHAMRMELDNLPELAILNLFRITSS
jgi:hypothetical protein